MNGTGALTRRKRILFRCLTVLLCLICIEAVSHTLLFFCFGRADRVRNRLNDILASQDVDVSMTPQFEVVHPYLGYVMHIHNDNYNVQQVTPFTVTDFGFYDEARPLHKRSPEKVIVAISGGSVAHQFSVLSYQRLAAGLARTFPDRRIEFVRVALSGYKQPQQLMTLSYLLALGGEFDVWINLDGFNEIALPGAENVAFDVYSAFPRSWQTRVVTGNDKPLLRGVGLVEYYHLQRDAWAGSLHPFGGSGTGLLIWSIGESRLKQRILEIQMELRPMKELDQSFVAEGPAESFADDQEMYRRFSRIWADCSWQMHLLCEANQIAYYHFLQPNRYYPSYPPRDASDIANRVQAGYPYLVEDGQQLKQRGVRYLDLTGLFRDDVDGAYYDFCHVNRQSNDAMADAIAAAIFHSQPAVP